MKTACLEIVDSPDQPENRVLLANQENKALQDLKETEDRPVKSGPLDQGDLLVTQVSRVQLV